MTESNQAIREAILANQFSFNSNKLLLKPSSLAQKRLDERNLRGKMT